MVAIVHCWKPSLQSLLGTSRGFSKTSQPTHRPDPVEKLLHQYHGKAHALPLKGKDTFKHQCLWQNNYRCGRAHEHIFQDVLLRFIGSTIELLHSPTDYFKHLVVTLLPPKPAHD